MAHRRISNVEELKKDYLAGNSLTQLQSKYGFERHALARTLKKAGVQIVQNNQKHAYNTAVFDHIVDEVGAYWLGFLYADGSLSATKPCMELALKSTDIGHLEKLRNILCPSVPISRREIKLAGKTHYAVRLSISNETIHNQLIGLGCTPRKSLTLTFPTEEQVPLTLQNHFIRGYFDGDGSVGAYTYKSNKCAIRCSFEGTQNMLQGIQKVFLKNIPGYTAVTVGKRAKQNSSVLQKGGNLCALGMYQYMYREATVFLERKKDIFDSFYKLQVAAQ